MNIVIIGSGTDPDSLVQPLAETISVNIAGIWLEPGDSDARALAEALEIPIEADIDRLLSLDDIDGIVDLSGSSFIAEKINAAKGSGVQIIDRSTISLICSLLNEQSRVTYTLIDELTREHWSLYEIGTSLASAKDLTDVYEIIVEQATKLTGTPIGSLAVYDEKTDQMYLAASIGFSSDLVARRSWTLRSGSLTSYILNRRDPVAIPDIARYPKFANPDLIKEGIRSVLGCPLTLSDRVVGIIYVDDLKVREFTDREISLLSLLSSYAVIAIEKAKLLEETRVLTVTDDLTKLYNHRHFTEQLDKEMSRARRYSEPLSLIIVDIDHFKHYNDENGHVKGNDLLIELATLLTGSSRDTDIVARFGGEEFTIICPETDKEGAQLVAERLRSGIEEHDFPCACNQPCGRITVSIGVANYPIDASAADELLDKADTALYRAKRAGRNRVCAY